MCIEITLGLKKCIVYEKASATHSNGGRGGAHTNGGATTLHLSCASYSRHTSPPKIFLSDIMNNFAKKVNHHPQVFSQIMNISAKKYYHHPQFFSQIMNKCAQKIDAPEVGVGDK